MTTVLSSGAHLFVYVYNDKLHTIPLKYLTEPSSWLRLVDNKDNKYRIDKFGRENILAFGCVSLRKRI